MPRSWNRTATGALPLLTASVGALIVAGCVGSASPGPTGSAALSAAAADASTPSPGPTAASQSPTPSKPATTLTAWGRIWDAVPPSFPLPADSEPTQLRGEPTSGTFAVPAAPEGIVGPEIAALTKAGYRLVGVNGPLEDGSRVIEVTGGGECRARVTIRKIGTVTVLDVLVASACSFA